MKISCPGCQRPLEVPEGTVGRRARCAYCSHKFVIADPRTMLDETVATWITQDTSQVKELQRLTANLAAQRTRAGV
mgnify:CR=1 FL=1